MESIRSLLARPHLSVITRHGDLELMRIQNAIEYKVLVDGRAELEEVFGQLLAARVEPTPKTLDLIGHSTAGDSLLQLGDWVINTTSATVTAFFRELAEQDVLPRLGVHSVRLLACMTAETDKARGTLCTLADILGLEVCGTNDLLYSRHYDADGFVKFREYMLVCSSDLRRERDTPARGLAVGDPVARILDVDALPAIPIASPAPPWRRYVASLDEVRSLLGLVRRTEGATMPGLLVTPDCEIAIPSSKPNAYHFVQLLLGGEFIRVYPEGADATAVVYSVEHPRALAKLVATFGKID